MKSVLFVIMNSFRIIASINNNKSAASLIFITAKPRLNKIHHSRSITLTGQFAIRPQTTYKYTRKPTKILFTIFCHILNASLIFWQELFYTNRII